MLLWFTHIRSGESHDVAAPRKRFESFVDLPKEVVESRKVGGRSVSHGIAVRKPEGGNLRSVYALPLELRGDLQVGDSAKKPVGIHSGQLQDLGHLGVVSERIQTPAGRDLHAEPFAKETFANHDLPDEGLTAGHVDVRHDIHPSHQLQPPLSHKLAEGCLFFGISIQKGFYKGSLVQGEFVGWVTLQHVERAQNDGQAQLQVFFARLEDSTFPVSVRNVPDRAFFPFCPQCAGRLRRCRPGSEK